MKIGIITDIHNNVIALDAVIQEFDKQKCRKIVCAGDIIGIGPYPEETVQRIMSIPNLVAVRGNHEKYLLEGMPLQYPNDEGMGYEEMEHHKWEHRCLTKSSIDFLGSLPHRLDFNEFGKNISVMHYCMNQENQYIRYISHPTESDLFSLFPETEQDIIIYGHNHARTICHSQNKWFINCGSLGCPAQEKNIARAAILEITDNNDVSVQSLEVKYDVSRVLEDIERLKYPSYQEIMQFFFGVE